MKISTKCANKPFPVSSNHLSHNFNFLSKRSDEDVFLSVIDSQNGTFWFFLFRMLASLDLNLLSLVYVCRYKKMRKQLKCKAGSGSKFFYDNGGSAEKNAKPLVLRTDFFYLMETGALINDTASSQNLVAV